MATDATGVPTSLGIPKFNTNVDAPSGQGSNAQMDAIDLLFRSRTTAAATTLWVNKLLAADANPSVQMLGSGQLSWGPGGAGALDTNLYRSGAGVLKTDGGFVVGGNSLSILNTTQGKTYRFTSQTVGALYLDDAAAGTVDLNLTSLGKFVFGYTLGAANAGQFGPTVGPGSSPGLSLGNDTNLYRNAAALLRTDGALAFTAQAASPLRTEQVAANPALQNRLLQGDANASFQIGGDGKIQWGAGGASALDTQLYRVSAGVLQTESGLTLRNTTANPSPILTLSNAAVGGGSILQQDVSGNLVISKAPAGSFVKLQGWQVTDTDMTVSGANNGRIQTNNGALTTLTLQNSNAAFTMDVIMDGRLVFGSADLSLQDTILYRSAAGLLKTDTVLQGDLRTIAASLTTARTGGAAAALPAAPVKYLALYDETGARVYVPAYS